MVFRSEEKDRLGWFLSDSSVRANLEWKTFCDIEINLPPLDVQKKFVAVYNALLENKKAYERGLDDLKLVCDGYIENLRRNSPTQKLGNYIELSDERNADNLGSRHSLANFNRLQHGRRKTFAAIPDVIFQSFGVRPVRKISFVGLGARGFHVERHVRS